MTAAHTPGPWMHSCADEWTTSSGRHAQFGRYDISAGSTDVASEDYYRIASVSNANNSGANKANASLIAAAPDLLAELQAAHRLLRLALQCMADAQYSAFAAMSKGEGLGTDGATRHNERVVVIAKATGAAL